MPKVKLIQSNFSTGELSPKALGRVDIARYPNACKSLKNAFVHTLGGIVQRKGTRYIGECKYGPTYNTRLVPYIISQDSAYMLEMGDYYARVYKPDGTVVESVGSQMEILHPYQHTKISAVDYCQSEDGMYLFHGDIYPNRLNYYAETKWACQRVNFSAEPFDEIGAYPRIGITLSSTAVGTGVAVTSGGLVFMDSDVGRAIIKDSGIAVITAYTNPSHVTAEITSAFDSTTLAAGTWNLDFSPQAQLTPGAKDPVGAYVSLVLDKNGWRIPSGVVGVPDPHYFHDVGKYIQINGGLIKVTSVTDELNAVGMIIRELSSAVAAPAGAWSLESSVWNSRDGYPVTGTIHEQRLVVAGSSAHPSTVWGSASGDTLDFTKGIDDADSFAFVLAGDDSQVNRITFVSSSRDLLMLTTGGESSIRGGVEKAITPTNVQIKTETPYGCEQVRPIAAGKETLFVQRSGRRLRAMGYKYDEDGYKSPDLTTLAEHLTASGVVCMAFQQEPEPVVWVALGNGGLISCTLDRDLDVVAWAHHDIGGSVKWVASMPYGDHDQVWMIVQREINGSDVNYIERFEEDWYPIYGTASTDDPTPLNWGYRLDCAISLDSAGGLATWTGLDHLEGEVVRVIADGVDMGEFTVVSGSITLPRTANRILAGKYYAPEATLLTPEIQMGAGSIQSDALSTNEVTVRVVDTISCTINGAEVIPGRENGPADLDTAPQPQTGDYSESILGWDKGNAEVTISQDAPFPWHILAVIRSVTANGG